MNTYEAYCSLQGQGNFIRVETKDEGICFIFRTEETVYKKSRYYKVKLQDVQKLVYFPENITDFDSYQIDYVCIGEFTSNTTFLPMREKEVLKELLEYWEKNKKNEDQNP